MTELKEALHARADHLTPPVIDYNAVVRTGERQVRRRRVGWIAGATATAAVIVGATGLLGPGDIRGKDRGTVTASSLPDQPSYAVGSVLHRGTETVDVGQEVHAVVVTSRGAVFTDANDHVYALVDGSVTEVGSTYSGDFNRLLVADVEGDRVAWITKQDGAFTVTTYDVATATTSDLPIDLSSRDPQVRALDGDALYVQDGPRVLRIVGTEAHVIKSDPDAEIIDARAGSVSYLFLVTCDECEAVTIDRPGDGQKTRLADTTRPVMSPDGRYSISDDYDEAWLFDNTTGARRDLSLPGWWFLAPYGWVDDDTIAGVAIEKEGDKQVSIVTCETSDATCQVVARDVGTHEPLAIALATGSDQHDE